MSLGPDRELDVGDVIVSNSVVILELAQPLRDEDQPVLIYLAQQNNGLAGLAGHRVASSVVVPLNVTQTPPSVASASADAIVTEVEFDQRIEPDSTDASQFVVIAGRRQIEVSSLDWRASAIDLTLAEPITALDAVELRYLAHEDDSGIRDLDGKRMAPDRVVVSNLTKRPRAWSERVEDARQRARGDAATLRREILRELSSDGLHVSLAWPDEALEHEPKPTRIAGSGIVASVRLSQNPTAKSKPKPWQLQIEPLEQFAQLHEFVPRAWDIAWEGEARNRFVAAWRIDVTDQHGTPIDHEVELTLRIPRPEASGPYRALVFNLFTGNWSEAPLSLVDGAIQVRLRGPALLTIAAMEPVETTMQPGLTELIFSGAEGTLLSEFATLFDESVQGAWIAGDADAWHYVSIPGPALALENGQTIWLVRPLEAAAVVVPLPIAVDYVDTEQTSGD